MTPNIFKYARKELSQDAVVCWLVTCARDAADGLRELGFEFVRSLMRSGDGGVIDVLDGQSSLYEGDCKIGQVLCEPKLQHKNIDVYFQAKVDGRVVSFIIEDKTNTEMHGDQLKRYLRTVKGDSVAGDLIKAVYLKTGHVFNDEREKAESTGYSVFDIEDMAAFLDGNSRVGVHEILRQYAEYIRSERNYRRSALKEWKLDEDFVQWEFMVRFGKVLQLSKKKKWPGKGVSRGGEKWTQYPHWDDRDPFFWRLDPKKPLRLMVDTSRARDRGLRALTLWDEWSRSFDEARREARLSAGSFRRVRTWRGEVVGEGTIGAVAISSCLETEGPAEAVTKVAKLHQMFIASLGD